MEITINKFKIPAQSFQWQIELFSQAIHPSFILSHLAVILSTSTSPYEKTSFKKKKKFLRSGFLRLLKIVGEDSFYHDSNSFSLLVQSYQGLFLKPFMRYPSAFQTGFLIVIKCLLVFSFLRFLPRIFMLYRKAVQCSDIKYF